jgi:hypothetical protein
MEWAFGRVPELHPSMGSMHAQVRAFKVGLFCGRKGIVEPVSVIENRVSGRIQDAKTEIEKSRTETGRRNSREIDGILSIISRRRPFADNFKRRPECRIGVSWLARVIHVVEHGVPQGFGAAKY